MMSSQSKAEKLRTTVKQMRISKAYKYSMNMNSKQYNPYDESSASRFTSLHCTFSKRQVLYYSKSYWQMQVIIEIFPKQTYFTFSFSFPRIFIVPCRIVVLLLKNYYVKLSPLLQARSNYLPCRKVKSPTQY